METLQWIIIGVLAFWLLLLSILHGAQHHQLNVWWWDFLKDMKKDWEKQKSPELWDDGHGGSWPPTY